MLHQTTADAPPSQSSLAPQPSDYPLPEAGVLSDSKLAGMAARVFGALAGRGHLTALIDGGRTPCGPGGVDVRLDGSTVVIVLSEPDRTGPRLVQDGASPSLDGVSSDRLALIGALVAGELIARGGLELRRGRTGVHSASTWIGVELASEKVTLRAHPTLPTGSAPKAPNAFAG